MKIGEWNKMYVSLDKKYLEKNMKKLEKRSMDTLGEDEGKGKLLFNEEIIFDGVYFENGELVVSADMPIGYFFERFPIDDDVAFKIIEHMKKKGNKLKRLINLEEE